MCESHEFYLLDKWLVIEMSLTPLKHAILSCALWYTDAITIHLARNTLPIILPVLHPGYIPANPIIRNFGPLPRRSFYSRFWLTRVLRLVCFVHHSFLYFISLHVPFIDLTSWCQSFTTMPCSRTDGLFFSFFLFLSFSLFLSLSVYWSYGSNVMIFRSEIKVSYNIEK